MDLEIRRVVDMFHHWDGTTEIKAVGPVLYLVRGRSVTEERFRLALRSGRLG